MLIVLSVAAADARAAENPDELYRQGRFTEAEKAYARADMENPKDIRHRYNRGCAAYQNSDLQAASAAFSSVLRRAQNPQMKFKAAFNLGNIAFKQNDFESATKLFQQAVLIDPQNRDARHNLELALRKAQGAKKPAPDNQEDQNNRKKEPSPQDGQNKQNQEGQNQDSDSSSDNQQAKKEKKQPQEKQENDKARSKGDDPKEKPETPRDLSGNLKPRQPMQAQQPSEAKQQPQTGAMLDRKKAEALLDNLKEDRSRFLQFQIPKDKRGAVGSGKDW